MTFYSEKDKKLYDHYIEWHNNIKTRDPKPIPREYIEVSQRGEVKMFRHPFAIVWCRFYGTWEELHSELQKDFPLWFPDVKFYSEISWPILI